MSAPAKRFRVAFSFAGEKREFVSEVAGILARRFGENAILYDKYHVAEFARGDLAFFLPDQYHDHSDLIVVVICAEYDKKPWCALEWNATFDLLKRGNVKEVMLCRFDHATVKGLYDLAGYVELDGETPETAARRILERLALNDGEPKTHYLESTFANSASSVGFRGAPSRLSSPSDLLVGREKELAMLDAAWDGAAKKNVVTIVAWGGVGKTSLVARWAADMLAKGDHGGVARYFDWSFYSQGVRAEGDPTGSDKGASADLFVKAALEFFGEVELAASSAGAWEKGERLARRVGRVLLYRATLDAAGRQMTDSRCGEMERHRPALRDLLRLVEVGAGLGGTTLQRP